MVSFIIWKVEMGPVYIKILMILYLGEGMVLLKHLDEGIATKGVAQYAQVTPRCCDIDTTFRARQNLLHQIILQLL